MNHFNRMKLFAMVIESFNDYLKKPASTFVQVMHDICGESVFTTEEMPQTLRELDKRLHDACRHQHYGRDLRYELVPRFTVTCLSPNYDESFDLFGVPIVVNEVKLGDVTVNSSDGVFQLTVTVNKRSAMSTDIAFEVSCSKDSDFSITNKLNKYGSPELRATIKKGLQGILEYVDDHAKEWLVFVNCQI